MMTLLQSLLFAILALQSAIAAEPKPSEASIRELMTAMEARKLTDGVWKQVDSMMQASMQQALAGEAVTPDQQKILDDMQSKMIALFKDEMRWDILEPMLIDIYEKSFTQREIGGMLEFYQTEPGKAVIAKMPIVMQQTMQAMQGRMTVLMPKLQQLQRDTIAQLKASQQK